MEIQLTGGEFFITHRALEILEDIRERLIPCSVFMNGTILPEKLINGLKSDRSGIIFYVSLDGPERIKKGKIVAHGWPKDVITSKQIKSVYGVDVKVETHPSTGCLNIMFTKVRSSGCPCFNSQKS